MKFVAQHMNVFHKLLISKLGSIYLEVLDISFFGADGVFRKVIAQCKSIMAVKSPVVSNILLKPIPPRKVKIQALSFQRKVK